MVLTADQVRQRLRAKLGGRTHDALAAELGVTQGYLSKVLAGDCNPGEKLLRQLGLRKVVHYELRKLHSPPPDADAELTPLESLRYWISAYSDPASGDHFMGHGRVVHLLREYLALREQQAG